MYFYSWYFEDMQLALFIIIILSSHSTHGKFLFFPNFLIIIRSS